jgi:hypothetical protein
LSQQDSARTTAMLPRRTRAQRIPLMDFILFNLSCHPDDLLRVEATSLLFLGPVKSKATQP